jgi:hypothetical protein
MEIIVEPVATKCAHYYCYTCITQSLEHSDACPICRTKIDDNFNLQVDKKLAKAIQKADPVGFKRKKDELKKSNSLESQTHVVRFKFGNTHRMVKKPGKCKLTGYLNKHKWSVYIKSLDKNLPERTMIDYVVIKLDKESFGTDQILLTRAPFKFTSAGWGCFEVPIIIFWKPWTKKEPSILKHMLSFEGKGKTSFLNIAVNLQENKV